MKFFNVKDILTIGITAFLFIWLANWFLNMAGLSKFTA